MMMSIRFAVERERMEREEKAERQNSTVAWDGHEIILISRLRVELESGAH